VTSLSPDARPYVDLTLLDRAPADVYQLALDFAASQLPEWTPTATDPAAVLLEAMALQVAEAIWAINRLPGATVETLLHIFGVTFDPGAAAATTIEFTMVDTAGHTVPAGTRVRVDVNGQPVVFTLDVDAVAATATATAAAAATASTLSAAPNGIAAGTPVSLLDAAYFVDTAAIAATVTGGRDPEDSLAWFNRAVQRFARLTETLNRADQFEAVALEDPAIHRVTAIDLYDGTGGPPYTDTGHISVYVYGSSGLVATADKDTLRSRLQNAAQVNLQIHVADATVNTVAVAAEITVLPTHTAADVIAEVKTVLDAFLSPLAWDWGTTVRLNDIIALIENVDGVDFTTAGSVLLNNVAADLALTGDAPLADAGLLTITEAP
jgi:uncharacterized phage protein gp47/JayE